MKTAKTIRMTAAFLAACLGCNVLAEDPAISNVVVRQRWPWSRLVNIDYTLHCAPTQRMDIIVSAYNATFPLTLAPQSLSGDLSAVVPGPRRIVWDPAKTAYTNDLLTRFRVDLTPRPVPLYMIVDLTKTKGDAGQIEYVYEEDLFTNKWGSAASAWVRDPVTNKGEVVESVIWTGVTNDIVYKTSKLVLRRIPAGTYMKGFNADIPVTLTKAFYAGVFEVTQDQWNRIMVATPAYFKVDGAARPVEQVSYNAIRGATNSSPAINWPATGSAVLSTSFLGKLREKTGSLDFDLPTETQWECLCRAGTTTLYNDGKDGTPNGESNAFMNVLGRYKWNGGAYWNADSNAWLLATTVFGPTNGTAIVGSYQPNAWGLYDTHGNVWEWCRDWNIFPRLDEPVDAQGPLSGTERLIRSGCWNQPALGCYSRVSYPYFPTYALNYVGFRVISALP